MTTSPGLQTRPEGELFAIPADLDTPALLVDRERLSANLVEIADLCRSNGVELFPHGKTHRTVGLGTMQIEHGALGLTVASLDEAEAFARGGVDRIVVAYPIVGEAKIERALALSVGIDLSLGVDSVHGVRAIGERFHAAGAAAGVHLLIDSGLGRCGVQPADALALAEQASQVQGITITGLLTHEGSVYEARDPDELVRRSAEAAAMMASTAQVIRSAGIPITTVSVGASASVRVAASQPGITQVRPGIYAFNDAGQLALGNATLDTCAACVVSTVVSHPDPTRGCIDAGSKMLSSDRLPPLGSQLFPGFGVIPDLPGWQLHRLSEEHGWLRWTGSGSPTPLAIGQRVRVVPNHICPVFSCAGSSYLVSDGTLVERLPTIARGRN